MATKMGVCGLELIKLVLEKKWVLYAGSAVIAQFFATLAFLACLSGAVVLRSMDGEGGGGGGGPPPALPPVFSLLRAQGFGAAGVCQAGGSAAQCQLLVALELAVLLRSFVLLLSVGRAWRAEARRSGEPLSFLSVAHGSTFFSRFFSLSRSLLVVLLAAMARGGAQEHPLFHFFLALTCVLSYMSLVRFAMGPADLAHFVIMIKEMVVTDMLRFMGVAAILLVAFAHAFFILGRFPAADYFVVWFRALLALVGEGEVELPENVEARSGITAFQVVYLIAGSLMLLNVLIAMMGNTYNRFANRATILATIERARLIREVERGMTDEERLALSASAGFRWARHDTRMTTSRAPPTPPFTHTYPVFAHVQLSQTSTTPAAGTLTSGGSRRASATTPRGWTAPLSSTPLRRHRPSQR
jgi:hypothetical protein